MNDTGSSTLTPRELAALRSLARTGDVHMAARELGITTHTIRHHRDNAYRRLGVHNLTDAYRMLGWLRTP